MKKGVIVLDAGHGGTKKEGESSPNNATSPSGVMEKHVTLAMAMLTREAIIKTAADGGHDVKVVLTRDQDINIGLSARARVARQNDADLFLSIHCNASDAHNARGVETLIRGEEHDNPNLEDDIQFATKIQEAVFLTIKKHDPNTRDRRVKEQRLGVLNDAHLGGRTRACLVELEFIDRPDVDQLLNIGPTAQQVRQDIASSLATALLDSLPET
jgi:N-acetylmuramoyl-L-alanine amidase